MQFLKKLICRKFNQQGFKLQSPQSLILQKIVDNFAPNMAEITIADRFSKHCLIRKKNRHVSFLEKGKKTNYLSHSRYQMQIVITEGTFQS